MLLAYFCLVIFFSYKIKITSNLTELCFFFHREGTDPFGSSTFSREWNSSNDPLERSKDRVRAAFEFFSKLGVPYYAFHDRDLAPEGNTLEETNMMLDQVIDLVESLQKETGVKLLWGTSNL